MILCCAFYAVGGSTNCPIHRGKADSPASSSFSHAYAILNFGLPAYREGVHCFSWLMPACQFTAHGTEEHSIVELSRHDVTGLGPIHGQVRPLGLAWRDYLCSHFVYVIFWIIMTVVLAGVHWDIVAVGRYVGYSWEEEPLTLQSWAILFCILPVHQHCEYWTVIHDDAVF